MNLEIVPGKDKLEIRTLSVTLDKDMTCGDLLDFDHDIEKIATRTCDIQVRKEDFEITIAMHATMYGRVQERTNAFVMNVQDNAIELNGVRVMARDENGKFQLVAENLGKVRSVDPGKPRLLYICVSRKTKLSDVLEALRELKLEPFVLSFMVFRDHHMHAL